MKINSDIKLTSRNLYLVPYEKHHVPKYHTWMQNKELQELTASEPLTLNEEYEMQKSWREDEDKCTFIIIEKAKHDTSHDEIDAMIGDTNIFINNKEELVGEIEIMIAEKTARGKKFGLEATILMLLYGIEAIHLKSFEAKISLDNKISIHMFKKLGFQEKTVSNVFQEITLEKLVTESWKNLLKEQYNYKIQAYYNVMTEC